MTATTTAPLAPIPNALSILETAAARFAEDIYLAEEGVHFSCSELNALATMLAVLGHEDAAVYWLLGHARGDEGEVGHDDGDDEDHLRLRDADKDGIGSDEGIAAARAYLRTALLRLPE